MLYSTPAVTSRELLLRVADGGRCHKIVVVVGFAFLISMSFQTLS
jgi:hypothetical protein